MLNMNEKAILELLSKRHLITKSELLSVIQKESMNGGEASVGRLKDKGFIDHVQNLGNCIVITKLGIKALKEG